MWMNLAASGNPSLASEKGNHAVKGANLIVSKMTADQIAEAQKLAREWKPKKRR